MTIIENQYQHDYAAHIETIASSLEANGYCIQSNFLPQPLVSDLFIHFKSLDDSRFSRAGIGKATDFQINKFVRTDEIHWLNGTHPVTSAWFEWIEHLRQELNRQLFLGLFDYECHYAFYSKGAYYKRHYDSFLGNNTRVVSTILYLNPNWCQGDGGELILYDKENRVLESIEPYFGRMVFFLSEDFPHEVLPVEKPRYSLTGWFRVNNSIGEAIDPPG